MERPFPVLCFSSLAAIPNVGDHVDADSWRFEIVDLDGRRIDKVLATSLPEPG
jgi:putative hemolysin